MIRGPPEPEHEVRLVGGVGAPRCLCREFLLRNAGPVRSAWWEKLAGVARAIRADPA